MSKAKAYHGEEHDVLKRPLKSPWLKPVVSLAVIVVVVLAVLQLLTLDGRDGRRIGYEASAIRKLQEIAILQNDYAASHPDKGFVCRLKLLTRPHHGHWPQGSEESGNESGSRGRRVPSEVPSALPVITM